ncbi:Rhoptry-associated protein 1 [Babesia duncani]|uniref:Rhoptry-associated protein 1 n=1 Tax=Babesia duncani TaxID=323732 RepID=A0AAD9PJA1_9APIC|nr:Rhoptry-associated protein 1 [Babesia duncani]
MVLSPILQFSFLALPSMLLNNVFALRMSAPTPIESPVTKYGDSLNMLFLDLGNAFHENFSMFQVATSMSNYAETNNDIVSRICERFESQKACFVLASKYINNCAKAKKCMQIEKFHLFQSPDMSIKLMNRAQLAAAIHVFRNSGVYEKNYLKRRFNKIFKRQPFGYSSYRTLLIPLLYSNASFNEYTTFSEIFITYYLNVATFMYATLIYRDTRLARFVNAFDKLNVLLIPLKKHLRNMVTGIANASPVAFCEEDFEPILRIFGHYLSGFDKSLTPLANRFAKLIRDVLKNELHKSESCILNRAGDFLKNAGRRAGKAVRDAGATIKERGMATYKGVKGGLAGASDKIRNRFRSRNGNGDDASSYGLLDEDATGEATDDVKPEDDSTGDNEPKEDEMTRL